MTLFQIFISKKVHSSTLTQAPKASIFNKEELDWIKAHPTQEAFYTHTATEVDSLDILTLRTIQEISGIQFKQKMLPNNYEESVNSQKDVIIGVNEDYSKHPSINRQYFFSKPFIKLIQVFVTKSNHPYISSTHDLKGVRATAQQNTIFYFKNKKLLNLIPSKDSLDIINKIKTGEVDVGIILDLHARLLLHNESSDIRISNPLDAPPIGLSIAVNKKYPILFSIIQKSLLHITTGALYENKVQWLDSTKQSTPTLRELWVGYNRQIILTILLITSLTIFLFLSLHAYRAKKSSEASKSQFLSMMSHELRTPLGIVIASTELLQNTPLSEKQRQLSQQTDQAARSLLVLLNDVLDISRINAGKLTLELRAIHLEVLLTQLYEQYHPLMQAKGLELYLGIQNLPDYLLLLDEVRIQQILHNLLSNALKFTNQGAIQLKVNYEEKNKELHLNVIDSGIGISIKQQAALFQPFIQASTSISRKYGGSGLGLSICKELVVLMGGVIRLKSTPNTGTQISIKLPVELSEQLISTHEASSNITPHTQINSNHIILLIEDHPANQQVIQEQLNSLGYRCQLANDGYQALALLAEDPKFALVLLDCHLPNIDGYQVAEQIRQQLLLTSLPIIAISATTGSEHHNRCMASGMDGVLSKPLKLAQLQSILTLWIDDNVPPPIESKPALIEQDLQLLFIKSNEEDFSQAVLAITQQDYPNAIWRIHRICGAARTLQAHEIANISAEIEEALQKNPKAAEPLMQKLRTLLDDFI